MMAVSTDIPDRASAAPYPQRMEQPQRRDPVVVEPVVNREKLRELLALEAEYPALDFKSVCNLAEKRSQVEFARHVGAMSVRGGFLVVGVDGQGKPTGEVTAAHVKLFDEASLRPRLLTWLPDTLEICSQTHDLDGHLVVLVHVAPNPAGCAIFRTDGQYEQPGKAAPKVVFREGDVFYRDGTQSVKLGHRGLELVIRQRVERERQLWEAEHAKSYQQLAAELRAGFAGQQVAQGPAVEFNLALEPEVLIESAIELLRANDDIPVRRLLQRAVPDLRALFSSDDTRGVEELLDRLTCLAATYLEFGRHEWFEHVLDTLLSIYGVGFEGVAPIYNKPPLRSAVLWLAIVERAFALGSLAVRRSDWPAVRKLAAQRHPDMNEAYTTWLRHARTMASRSELFTTRDGSRVVVESLLSRARAVVRRLECLRPDIRAEDEKVLNGLTQFDFLAGLVAMADSNNTSGVYPNFAQFYTERTRPAAQRLLRELAMRKIIYPGHDQQFASALSIIDREARKIGFDYDGWDGYPQEVNEFIREHGAETSYP